MALAEFLNRHLLESAERMTIGAGPKRRPYRNTARLEELGLTRMRFCQARPPGRLTTRNGREGVLCT